MNKMFQRNLAVAMLFSGMGFGGRIEDGFRPFCRTPEPPKEPTKYDLERLREAEEKRQRKALKKQKP